MADNKPKLSRQTFVSTTFKLLEKERDAEIEETRVLHEKLPAKELQRRGVCLLKLHISNTQTGLFGRVVIVFETHLDTLPSHTFSPGDIIGLSNSQEEQAESLGSGVVTKVGQTTVSVAFTDNQDLFNLADGLHDYYKITKLANDVTYKRLKRTLGNLEKFHHNESTHLVDVLFGEAELLPPYDTQEVHFINNGLDDSQRDAVVFTLGQQDVAVVHGPPGTGKTTTIIEIILQAVKRGNKILACAPSNIAVDNLVERLAVSKTKMVRLGHPARLLPHLQKFSLDAILANSDATKLIMDVRKDMDNTMSSIRKERDRGGRQKLREDMKSLRKELRQREEAATRDILIRADVVLVTLTSATNDGPLKLMKNDHFDIAVIDEVSQSMEVACWIPLLRARKCVLAGDHLQLPPTILSHEAAKAGLDVTLMERVLDLYGDKVMRMLTTQYRMNTKIMQWSSDKLYESKLIAHSTVKDHLLRDLPEVEDNEVTATPLLYIDTAGCDLTELDLPEEISKGNEGEADIVAAHVERLVVSGLKQEQVAVIAPYNLQVELIRLRLFKNYPKVEVKSVDGFQGREKEAVVISLVRSNTKGEVGFLSERRRINVAVTRARRHLTVIGDSTTVGKDPFLKSLVDYMNNEGDVQSAQQYIDCGILQESSIALPEHVSDMVGLPKQDSNKGARPKQPRQPKSNKHNNRPIQSNRDKENREKKEADKGERSRDGQAAVESQVQDIQAQLDKFMLDGSADMLEFPSTLTAHDRFLVHELSEKLALGHTSKGVGEERYIVVTKPGSSTSSRESDISQIDNGEHHCGNDKLRKSDKDNIKGVRKSMKSDKDKTGLNNASIQSDVGTSDSKTGDIKGGNEEITNTNIPSHESKKELSAVENQLLIAPSVIQGTISENSAKSDGKVTCNICGKDVIQANITLHELHCAKRQQGQDRAASAKSDDTSGNKKKAMSKSAKPRQFDKELAKKVESIDDDDLDTLLDTVKKLDGVCCFKKCKVSVQTLCSICQHCEGRYCMSHYMPEIHGCGDAARAHARARIGKDGVLYRGSGTPNKKPDEAKKAHLQRRLDSKLSDLASQRKGKPKKKK